MLINLGSTNKIKIEALKEMLNEYSTFSDYKVIGMNVISEVSEQPLSLEETIQGAVKRAINSFSNCEFSFGLESGLMKVPYTISGYLEFCACAYYDGMKIHLGLSSAWEPSDPEIISSVFSDGLNLTQAANKANLTSNTNIGEEIGVVGIVSKGKFLRKDQVKEAIRMSLIDTD